MIEVISLKVGGAGDIIKPRVTNIDNINIYF